MCGQRHVSETDTKAALTNDLVIRDSIERSTLHLYRYHHETVVKCLASTVAVLTNNIVLREANHSGPCAAANLVIP